jgi:perosamine synthetase
VLRRQLPVHSPLGWRQIAAGARALAFPFDASTACAQLIARYDARAMVATDSGTTALRLALAASGATRSRPVLLPAYGCFDLATAAVGAGVPVLLYDVDPLTLGPDVPRLRALAAGGFAAVVVAYVYGVPVDLDPVRELCSAHEALLIEDAAQAHGGTWRGRPLGAHGDMSIVSFGRGKGMTAGGGGALLVRSSGDAGALLTSTAPLAAAASLPTIVKAVAHHVLGRPALFGLPSAIPWLAIGETVYHVPSAPRGLSASSAAMLGAALRRADAGVAARRRRAEGLAELIPDAGQLGTHMPKDGVAGYLRLPVLAPTAAAREVRAGVGRHLGIARGYPLALAALGPLARSVAASRDGQRDTSGARELALRLLTLPTHELLTDWDREQLSRWIAGTW